MTPKGNCVVGRLSLWVSGSTVSGSLFTQHLFNYLIHWWHTQTLETLRGKKKEGMTECSHAHLWKVCLAACDCVYKTSAELIKASHLSHISTLSLCTCLLLLRTLWFQPALQRARSHRYELFISPRWLPLQHTNTLCHSLFEPLLFEPSANL